MGEGIGRGAARSWTIPVRIMDARSVFGRDEYLVTPTPGAGEAWIAAGTVENREGRAK